MIMNQNEMNPWKGLDIYHEGEILYGRDEDIRKLSQYVLGYDDTVLYGRSGIGKSSLLNAGILPAARIAGFVPVYIRLNHENKESYFEQILHAVEGAGVIVQPVSSIKNPEHPLLWELFYRNRFLTIKGETVSLLLVLDQFEEIFTLQQNVDMCRQFFYQIGSVLNKVKPTELEVNSSNVEEPSILIQESILKTGLVMKVRKGGNNNNADYNYNNIIHFVFTLREDFLSDFEYFTSQIPSLKQHRYGLRSINEEQAAEIILRPRKGLVSKEVAKLIIQKVTQRLDFELDGIPEIEVDAAVLSLYMKRLFEAHEGDEISASLVEEKGNEIIKNFYLSSIADIKLQSIEYLENTLVNEDNRRENKSYNAVSNAIGKECVDKLIERSILHKFYLNGEYKVEYIHDILCTFITQLKKERIINKKIQLAEQKKLLYKQLFKVGFSFFLFFIAFLLLYAKCSTKLNVKIQLVESNTISNDEYWKASVVLLNNRDTIAVDTVDKVKASIVFELSQYLEDKKIVCHIEPIVGNIVSIKEQISFSKSHSYTFSVDKLKSVPYLSGNVRVASGSGQPVIGAVVIWGNQVVKTDKKGNFSFQKPLEYSIISSKDSTIKIIKQGYKILDENLHEKGKKYKLQLKNPSDFYDRCNLFEKEYNEAIKHADFIGKMFFNGSSSCSNIEMKIYRPSENRIRGFYYYKDNINHSPNRHFLYILLDGILHKNGDFVVTAIDDAWNMRTLSGKISKENVIEGQIYANNEKFIFRYEADSLFVTIKDW